RPKRDPLAVGQAPASSDERTAAETAQGLLHEPRLPDAGDSEDGEELAGVVGDRLLERIEQPAPLAFTSDHRRGQAPSFPGVLVGESGAAPEFTRFLGDDSIADEPVGRSVADQLAGSSDS